MTENVYSNELQSIVNAIARSGALTPEAITQFEEMRKKVVALEGSLLATQRSEKSWDALARERGTRIAVLEQERDALVKRIAEYEVRVLNLSLREVKAECALEARVEMRSILSDVFRNAQIMRSITTTTPVPINTGPSTYVSNYENRETYTETTK